MTNATDHPSGGAPSPADPEAPTRVLLAGLGRTGLALGAALSTHPAARVVGAADPSAALRRFARGAGFAVPSYARLSTLVTNVEWDAAVVTAPRERRAAWAAELAAGGRPVLVLQPVGATAADAGRLTAARGNGGALHAGASVLFHPIFRRARQLIREGALGRLRGVRASVFVSRVFSVGSAPATGDVLDHFAGDLLALLDALFGPARSVEASFHRLYGERVDEVHASLRVADDLEVGVDASWSVPGYPRASLVVEVDGESARLIASDDALELERTPVDADATPTRWVAADFSTEARYDVGGDETWLLADAFLRAARSGAPDAAESLAFDRGLRVLALTDAIRRSADGQGGRIEVGG